MQIPAASQGIRSATTGPSGTEALAGHAADLDSILDAMPVSVAILAQSGAIVRVNQLWRHFALRNNYAHGNFGIGLNYLSICDEAARDNPDLLGDMPQKLRDVLAGTSSGFEFEYDGSSSDTVRYFSLSCEPLVLSGELGCLIAHREVTREELAYRELQLDRSLLMEVLSNDSKDEVFEAFCAAIESSGRDLLAGLYYVTKRNEAKRLVLGPALRARFPNVAELSEMQMIPLWRAMESGTEIWITDKDSDVLNKGFREALSATGIHFSHLIPIISEDGNLRIVIGVLSAHDPATTQGERSPYTRLMRILRIALDRWAAMAAAERERRRYALAFEASQDGLWDWDIEAGSIYRSPRCFEILGFTNGDPIAASGLSVTGFQDMIHSDDYDRVMAEVSACLGGNQAAFDCEYRMIGHDGKVVWVKERGVVFRDADGTPVRMAGSISDLTKEKEAEQTRRQAETFTLQGQKMEALGRLSGSIAHDFNNLLMIVGAYSARHKDKKQTAESLAEALSEIHRAYERGTGLTKQLLAFSRTQVLEKRVVEITDILDGLTTLLKPLVGPGITLAIEPGERRDRITIDASLFSQALINLVINAKDAMPSGGTVKIEVGVRTVSAEEAADIRGGKSGEFAVVTVADNGQGIDEAIIDKVFEPFFTTKPVGKGTGLGLSMVYSLVNEAGGFVEVGSKSGQGTKFSLHLPLQAENAAASDAASDVSGAARAGKGEKILLVEDEDAIRKVLQASLEQDGYRVMTAANGIEGIEAEVEADGDIDLILTDLIMPRMGGLEMARLTLEARPNAKFIFMTGQPERGLAHYSELLGQLPFIQKPFAPDSLKRLIRDVLESKTGQEIRPAN
jgi:PAS domain S-box-containing protein